MLKYIIAIVNCTIISFISICSQFEYYDNINLAEETFVLQKNKNCFLYYDKAFSTEAIYFAKDAYVASEIALYLNDLNLMKKYLKLSFELGMPFTALESGEIYKKKVSKEVYSELLFIFNNCKKREINTSIRDSVYSYCFSSDSIKFNLGKNPGEEKAFYELENRFRDYLFNNFLKNGVFPNENVIGIASDSIFSDFIKRYNKIDRWKQAELELFGTSEPEKMENDFVSKFSFSVLLHSCCSFQKFEPFLYRALENGFLSPNEYALLKETGVLWYRKSNNSWEDCTLEIEDSYYNILGFDPMAQHQTYVKPENRDLILKVEENRSVIHMQKFNIDQEKMKVQKQLGIRFFFGFIKY